MDRRRFLAAAAGASAVATAGCSTGAAETTPPDVPESRLTENGWQRVDETEGTVFEESYGPVTVTAVAHTLRYEKVSLSRSVREDTLGAVDAPLAVFFATRVDFSPPLEDLPAGVGRAQLTNRVRENAESDFESRLEAQGLVEVTREERRSLTVDTGEEADVAVYSAVYPFDGVSFSVGDGQSIELEGDGLTIGGRLATWHHDGSILVAGGAFPAENYARTTEKSLSDAIEVGIEVDLGLEPDAYREELRSIIAAVG